MSLLRKHLLILVAIFAVNFPAFAADASQLSRALSVVRSAIGHVDYVISKVYGQGPGRCDRYQDYANCAEAGCMWSDGFCTYGRQRFGFAGTETDSFASTVEGEDEEENDYAAAVVLSLIKFKLNKSESLLNEATNAVVSGDFARANVLTQSACVVMGFAKFKAEAGKITVLIPGPQSITIDDFDRISTDLTLARSLAGC